MNQFVMALTYQGTFSENALTAVQMTILGLGAVFAALAILWLFLSIFKAVFHDLPEKKKAKSSTAEEATKEIPEIEVQSQEDEQMVAVISAAVAAYLTAEKQEKKDETNTGFRVVSFRRSSQVK